MNKHLFMSFKIRPVKELYYKVFIYKTKEAMQEHEKFIWERFNPEKKYTPALACCWSYYSREKKFKNKLGDILFHKGCLGSGGYIVAHEIAHAAVYAAPRLGIKINKLLSDPNHDEAFAKVTGQMNRQFWHYFYRKGGNSE